MRGKIALVILIIGALIIGGWFITTNNNLVSLREDVELQKAQVATTLQRRSDLIPNLVATVKGYAKHEETVFTEIADARSKLAGSIESGDLDQMNEANNALDSALSRLLVITENYPTLVADKQFIALQNELAGTENRISFARQQYNETVQKYNKAIQMFPGSFVASMSGHTAAEYFEADENATTVPTVNFD